MQSCTCRAGRLRATCLTLNPGQISALMPLTDPSHRLPAQHRCRQTRSLSPCDPHPPSLFSELLFPCFSLTPSSPHPSFPIPLLPPSLWPIELKLKPLRTPIRGMTPQTPFVPQTLQLTDRQLVSDLSVWPVQRLSGAQGPG